MILVYGATGTTGTLVAQTLAARGLPFAVSGRDRARVCRLAEELGVEARVAPVHDEAALAAAMAGARVVVSCAGPYVQVGEPVLAAALAAGCSYLDVCGEQRFVRDVHERFDSRARHAGLTVVSAFGFESAIGDFAAALAARELCAGEEGEVALDEVAVAYAIDRPRLSRGTNLSIVASLGQPGAVWVLDRWEETSPAAELRSFGFPAPFGEREAVSFPAPDVITVPRHVDAHRVQTYMALLSPSAASQALTRTASFLSPLWPGLMKSPLGALARARAGSSRPSPGAGDRARTRFAVLAEATRKFRRARVVVTGADIYRVSAEAVCLGAEALLEGPPARRGVLAPAEALAPDVALRELADRCGLEIA